MRLKKYLRSQEMRQPDAGQVFVEYFVLLCIMAFLTIVATSVFYKNIQQKTEDYTTTAIGHMAPYFQRYDDTLRVH